MKKMIKILSMILIFGILSIEAYSVGEGNTQASSGGEFVKVGAAGAQFLKIGVGARANALAGAYSALGNDLTSIFWNPAGVADLKRISANFSYTQWFAGFGHNYAAIALPIGESFTAAVNIISLSSDKIMVTTIDRPEGTGTHYYINDLAFGVTLGGYLSESFSFGINAKYIRNSFSSLASSGIAFDVGTMYKTGIQGIKLGVSISNLGSEQQYTGQDLRTTAKLVSSLNMSPIDAEYIASAYSIPIIFRAGLSSDIIDEETNKLSASCEFTTLSDTKEQFAFGVEYTWNKMVVVRGGYRFGLDQMGLAGGLGLTYPGGGFNGSLDYSITPTKNLGLVNRVSINLGL